MPREFSRNVRVASQLQRELAELLRSEVRDPRLGMVTVSDVEVTRDLSVAKVYVSFLGARQTNSESLKLLAGLAPLLRHEVARRVRMRVIPELRFIFDDSVERGLHMDAVIDSLHLPKSDPHDT
ncbi:30S ribosome-binding factor RbfA [Methylolobus aquaticus]